MSVHLCPTFNFPLSWSQDWLTREVQIIHKGKGEGLGNKIKPGCGGEKLVQLWNVSDVAEGHPKEIL